MTQGNRSISGRALRRRVRQATVGVVGAAALATAGGTVGLAHAATTDQVAATDSSTVSTNTGSEPRTTTATRSSSPSSSSSSSSSTVKAPTQAPSASNGQSHASSGGS